MTNGFPKYIVIDGYIFTFRRVDRGGFAVYRNRWGDETIAGDVEIAWGSDNLEELKERATNEQR